MENIFQAAELTANSDNPDMGTDKEKNTGSFFFFFSHPREIAVIEAKKSSYV